MVQLGQQQTERRRLILPEGEQLLRRIQGCRICVDSPRGRPLPHEPRPVVVMSTMARVLIAGQAPGVKVHASGRPFTDASGDRLRQWLNVTADEFYDPHNFAILPMGFCFPGNDAKGGDLPPRRECAPAWRDEVMQAMPQIEMILAIGSYAQAWHMPHSSARSLNERVRNWRMGVVSSGHASVLPLPHPSWRNTAWIKKNPWFAEELLPFLQAQIRARISALA